MAEANHNHKQDMSPSPPFMAESSSSPTFLPPPAPQLMPIQLTENNYILWKSLFIPVLKAYNMLNHAQGRECPPQFLTTDDEDEEEKESRRENPAYTSWIQKDQMFLTWINASLSPKLLGYTRDCTSGQALWVHLEDVLAKSAETHVLGLKDRLQNLKFFSLEGYLKQAREITDELEAAGCPVNDRELTSHFLEALPEDYEEVVASIRNQPHHVTIQELLDLLRSHRKKITLKARLQNLKLRGSNLKEYLKEAEVLAFSLERAGAPVSNRELTCHILEGLPECYGKLVRSQPYPLTQPELHNLLLSHRFPRPFSHKLCTFVEYIFGLAVLAFLFWFGYKIIKVLKK